ncbi:hypothetical protein V6N11_062124 [Hibiscus sabdariffa]|uniref:Uncharacterized protein n=2 Tax=Hibiscus sabdariffa TaxID=183260 RepID=A0ABR2PRL8_9ROSI
MMQQENHQSHSVKSIIVDDKRWANKRRSHNNHQKRRQLEEPPSREPDRPSPRGKVSTHVSSDPSLNSSDGNLNSASDTKGFKSTAKCLRVIGGRDGAEFNSNNNVEFFANLL